MQTRINLIVLGDAAIGKTSVLRNVDNRDFQPSHLKTIAVDYVQTQYLEPEEGKKIPVKIWDTAGQEKFRNITYSFYRQADGVMLGCDITNKKSFESVANWINSIFKVKEASTPVVLFANKVDLEESRVVSQDEFYALKNKYNMNVHQTSAKTGQGVQELVNDICAQVYAQKNPNASEATGSSTTATESGPANLAVQSEPNRQLDRPSFPLTQKS